VKPWQDLDYFRTTDKVIYLVKGDHHDSGHVRAYPVYYPDGNGERSHEIHGSYRKDPNDPDNERLYARHPAYRPTREPLSVPAVSVEDIEERFLPRDALERFLDDPEQKDTIWWQMYLALHEEAGVPQEMIGIIGSYLVELHRNKERWHIKDIDFVIYGLENMRLVKESIEQVRSRLGASGISPEHAAYHAQKFSGILGPQTTLEKTLSRKWPSLQLAPGLLATLRFVCQPDEVLPDSWALEKVEEVVISGEVIDADYAVFMPRRFTVQTESGTYQVVIPYWGFHGCVQEGDRVEIGGVMLSDEQTVALLGQEHFLAIK